MINFIKNDENDEKIDDFCPKIDIFKNRQKWVSESLL